jgi:SnoaL-like domain
MDREIRILLDERALNALLNRYCHTMDTGDNAGWLDCFTADALYEVGLPNGTVFVNLRGTDDFKKFIATYPVRQGHQHVYVTPAFSVDPEAGTATIDSYFFMLAGDATHSGISSLGRCHDECVRTDAGWRIKARRVVAEAMTPP